MIIRFGTYFMAQSQSKLFKEKLRSRVTNLHTYPNFTKILFILN